MLLACTLRARDVWRTDSGIDWIIHFAKNFTGCISDRQMVVWHWWTRHLPILRDQAWTFLWWRSEIFVSNDWEVISKYLYSVSKSLSYQRLTPLIFYEIVCRFRTRGTMNCMTRLTKLPFEYSVAAGANEILDDPEDRTHDHSIVRRDNPPIKRTMLEHPEC